MLVGLNAPKVRDLLLDVFNLYFNILAFTFRQLC